MAKPSPKKSVPSLVVILGYLGAGGEVDSMQGCYQDAEEDGEMSLLVTRSNSTQINILATSILQSASTVILYRIFTHFMHC